MADGEEIERSYKEFILKIWRIYKSYNKEFILLNLSLK